MPRLCLIDAHSLCYRAFFAIKTDLMTSYGQPTNAVYGFVNMLNRILNEIKPEYMAICFDTAKPTFREEKFKDYKIHRLPMPDSLKSQIPLIREIILAYNIKTVEKDGFEADDIIATLACRAENKNFEVTIVTTDKDMLQLVDDHISVYNPYKGEGVYFDIRQVEEKFGVKPKNIVDLLSLMGDSVDNIPGVKGIGEKTASGLLKEFKSIDRLLNNLDKIKSDKLKDLIRENKKMIILSRELAELPTNIEVDLDLKDLSLGQINSEKLYEIFSKLEFKSLLKNLCKIVQEKDVDKKLNFSKHIEESKDIDKLEKEIAKTNGFSFSFRQIDDQFKFFIYPGKDNVYAIDNLEKLQPIFQNKNFNKIGENIKLAKQIFNKSKISIEGDFFDVVIAAYLCDPARTQYSIESLLYDYLKIGPLASQDLEKNRPVFIYKLKEGLEKELKEKNLMELFYKLEMPLIDVLFRMENNGIMLDKKLLKDFSKLLSHKQNKLISEIFAISNREFNINSPKQLRQVLFEELKLPVVRRTKTGPSTDEGVLRKLSASHKIPSLILEYRQIVKLKSTYVDVLPDLCDKKTGRIHSNFLQTGTETGRLSSNNPNLQNIPIKTELGRQIRKAFVSSSSNWSLLSSDYSQIELRILAHLSKDDALIDAFSKDSDIHKITASLIYQIKLEDVQDGMREIAKRVNFAVLYGMSAYGLSKDLDIGVEIAQDFIDTYFLRYAKVKDYINKQIDLARDKGYVSTIMGRRRYLPYINSKNNNLREFGERQAVNTPIQGSAADLIKLAMIDIQNQLDQNQMKSKMALQVHDELVFDFPLEEKSMLINIVKKSMQEAIKLDVPVRVSLKIGQNWAEMTAVK